MNIGGKKVPTWAVYGGVGVAVVGGILYFRSRGSSPAGGSASQTDPVTGLPYSMDSQVDPQTGLTYLAEAQQYGSVSAAEAALAGTGAGAGAAGYGGGISGYGYGYPTSDITGSGGLPTTTYTTNAQWVQAATAGLEGLGYNGSDVGAALGLYLLGMALNSTQVTIVQTAVAEFGPPPVGTFAIIASPNSQTGSTGSGSGGTSGTGGNPPVPPAGPGPGGKSKDTTPAQVTGLHATGETKTSIGLAWDKAANAQEYQVRVTYQGQVIQTHFTTATSFNVTGLSPARTYGLHVVAVHGTHWAPEASIEQKTSS